MRRKLIYLIAMAMLVIAAAAILSSFLVERRVFTHHRPAAELVPAQTLAFLELPDLARTSGRWPKTALYALWQEPEVRDFMAQPLAKYPSLGRAQKWMDLLGKAKAHQMFVAITSVDGNALHYVGGISFGGGRAALDALLADPRAAFREAHPAGKSDLVMHGKDEIQTYTDGPAVLAEAVSGDWYFFADSVDGLQGTLDLLHQPQVEGSLAGDDLYRHAVKPLPGDPEMSGFARTESMAGQITDLLTASGQTIAPENLEGLKRFRALGFATRIEGADLQDTIFAYAPGAPTEPKTELAGFELTTPQTLLFSAGTLSPRSIPQLASVADAIGSDLSLSFDWPNGALPSLVFSAPVRDAAKLRSTLDGLFPADARSELNGATVYTIALGGLLPISPVLAFDDHFVAVGLAAAPLTDALHRADGKSPTLASVPAFQAALKSVPPPQGSFAYVNLGALVDRAYGTGRPVLAMSLAFNPATSPYLDASKLPPVDALSKHFGASVFSRSATAEGDLLVARGAVTIPELILGVGGMGAAAAPLLQGSLPAGLQLPGLPGSH